MNLRHFNTKEVTLEWIKENIKVYGDTNPLGIDMSVHNPSDSEHSTSPSVFLTLVLDHKDNIEGLSDINRFIETGTCSGISSMSFATVIDHVDTVDVRPWDDYKSIKEKYPNINFWQGQSTTFLENLLPTIPDERCVFLLDAHDGTDIVPINEEINLIKTLSNVKDHVIIVDDCVDCSHGNFPSLDSIRNCIQDINPDYKFIDGGNVRRTHIAYV